MQISSRIHIRVKDEKMWEKLKEINIDEYGFPSTDADGALCNIKGNDFIVDGMWSYDTNKLVDLVRLLSGLLGKGCVIAADSTNLSGDSNLYIISYCGESVKTKLLFRNDYVDIINLKKWFTYFTGKCALTKTEKEYLKNFDVDILTEKKKKTAEASKGKPDFEKYIIDDPNFLIPKITKDTNHIGRFCIVADNDEHFAMITDVIRKALADKTCDCRTVPELRMIYTVSVESAGCDTSYRLDSDILWSLFEEEYEDCFIGVTDYFDIIWYDDTSYSESGNAYYYFGDREKYEDESRSWACYTFDVEFSAKARNNAELNITDLKGFITAYFGGEKKRNAKELMFAEKILGSAANDFVIENGVLTEYTGDGGNVIIPDGVKKIGNNAFFKYSSILSVVIPESVTEIGHKAFGSSSLTSITTRIVLKK